EGACPGRASSGQAPRRWPLAARVPPAGQLGLHLGPPAAAAAPLFALAVVAASLAPEQLVPLPHPELILNRKARDVTDQQRPCFTKKKSSASRRPPPT